VFPDDPAQWSRWLALEDQHRKREALALAEELAASLARAPVDSQDRWVQSVCEDVIDLHPVPPDVGIPRMRYPFLRDVIVPSLMRRLARQDATAARWAAWLMRRYSNTYRLWQELPDTQRHPMGLLRMADTWAPGDVRVMESLAEMLSRRFHDSMHELPAGVLFGMNGADVAECAALLEELAHLERLWTRLGQMPLQAHQVASWRRIITCYADYLSRGRGGGFEAYLQLHFPDWSSAR
jgi:hypothetical protein